MSEFKKMADEMSCFIKTYEKANKNVDRQESINMYFIYKIEKLSSIINDLKETNKNDTRTNKTSL